MRGWKWRNFGKDFYCLRNFSTCILTDRVPPMTSCEDKICGNFAINRFAKIKADVPCFFSIVSISTGGTLNAEVSNVERTIVSNIRPFRLAFHTDSTESGDIDNRGFCLDYIQVSEHLIY